MSDRPPQENSDQQDALEPLDLEYAQAIVEGAPELERIQKMLPSIPANLVGLIATQPDTFLFGIATTAQAIHDLIGIDILLSAAEVLKNHKDNQVALATVNSAVQLIGLLEALGYLACKNITDRSENAYGE